MDIELLKTFLEVCKTRHFGRAADNLYLTQSAVSARIRQLEGLLGCELFNRQRNNIQLTAAGESLLLHADNVLQAWERARQDVALRGRQSVSLNLASTAGLWDTLLQDALQHLHESLPELVLRADIHSSDVLVRKLLDRTLDIALLYDPPKAQELVSRQLTHLELVMVSSQPGLTATQALEQGYIMVDWGTAFQLEHAQQLGNNWQPWLFTSHGRMALDLILQQGGHAYLPRRLVRPYLAEQRLHLVQESPCIRRDVYGVYHTNAAYQDTITAVMEILYQRAQKTAVNCSTTS
ncbi:LysR family transcriptional regulator [Balneatrix alpica]|uniref:LysR family transcriptional regulator n=1 Tax=Balneatrix alpica TaxID=75684 RepID=A0ABV5ZEW3_9GAMM|nr:LysR family transcriptional regulator [Balneatrix alpica]